MKTHKNLSVILIAILLISALFSTACKEKENEAEKTLVFTAETTEYIRKWFLDEDIEGATFYFTNCKKLSSSSVEFIWKAQWGYDYEENSFTIEAIYLKDTWIIGDTCQAIFTTDGNGQFTFDIILTEKNGIEHHHLTFEKADEVIVELPLSSLFKKQKPEIQNENQNFQATRNQHIASDNSRGVGSALFLHDVTPSSRSRHRNRRRPISR